MHHFKVLEDRVSAIPGIPWMSGNILRSKKAYLENSWINFSTGIHWKKFSGHYKYLDSLGKIVVVVVVVALANGCSFSELGRTFHESTRKLSLKEGIPQRVRICHVQMAVECANQPVNVSIGALSQVLDRRGLSCMCLWVWKLLSHLTLTHVSAFFFFFVLEIFVCSVGCFLLMLEFVNWPHCMIKYCFFKKQMNCNVF